MNVFKDYYDNTVKFMANEQRFSKEPKHVWVITKYKDKWLLTRHSDRGLEFPGGKVEPGENAEEAAIREVMEETGGNVSSLRFVGQYFVDGKGGQIIKNVYFAKVDQLDKQEHYFETEGPVLFDRLPRDLKKNDSFSFMMKDDVLKLSMDLINQMNT
ncbi:nucleoside triphosphatase YtkD [Halalkalibacillus sediminis]|uniref:Nucleoside triphosphatase YtkD n=1 Tax=Halalkalibacillus sediminis TaxID=2018042 RepID=A0A2I0QVL7_9BACI|nr:nucleoside triphosphatase YtkD [Halalkalibacillus sediminis]PKR78140.1 nucleoside triphosphatase YtkD [Halalkalibacillus sediminis]